MVADVVAGTAFLEIARGDGGKVQSVIKLLEAQQSASIDLWNQLIPKISVGTLAKSS